MVGKCGWVVGVNAAVAIVEAAAAAVARSSSVGSQVAVVKPFALELYNSQV